MAGGDAFPGGTPPLLASNLTLPAGPGYGAQTLISLLNTLVSISTPGGYEIGDWIPALVPTTSGAITMNAGATTARFTRLGRLVYVSGYAKAQALAAPVGPIRITNLPFAAAIGSNIFNTGSVLSEGLNAAIVAPLLVRTGISATGLDVFKSAAGGQVLLDSADITAAVGFYFSLCYST